MTQIKIQNDMTVETVDVDLTKIIQAFLSTAPTELQKKRVSRYLEQGNIEGIVEYVWAAIAYGKMYKIDFAKMYAV